MATAKKAKVVGFKSPKLAVAAAKTAAVPMRPKGTGLKAVVAVNPNDELTQTASQIAKLLAKTMGTKAPVPTSALLITWSDIGEGCYRCRSAGNPVTGRFGPEFFAIVRKTPRGLEAFAAPVSTK